MIIIITIPKKTKESECLNYYNKLFYGMMFESYIKDNKVQFLNKVNEISKKLDINPDWLMAIMYHESRFKTDKPNTNSNAIGLIQFMPSTYQNKWGLSASAIAKMNNVQQLDLVYDFYKDKAGKFKSYTDLHLYAFMPVMVGKPKNSVIQAIGLSADTIAKQNFPFDLNKDNSITVKEFEDYLYNFYSKEMDKKDVNKLFGKGIYDKKTQIGITLGSIAIIGVATYFVWNYYNIKRK